MIEAYYGFRVAPFRLMPDPQFFFLSETHARALAFLEYGLEQGEGHIVLTGDVGVGKSMVIAHLLQRVERAQMQIVALSTSNLAPLDALRRIAHLLGVSSTAGDKAGAINSIEQYLHQLAHEKRRALIIIDEAQCLPNETLDELRMLANLEVRGCYPLQCFFIGQSEFRTTLNSAEFAPLRQRVIAAHHLEPLGPSEVAGYAEHRLAVAGWQGRPTLKADLFSQLHRASGGVPRVVNSLLGRLLLFGALERLELLGVEELTAVLSDLERESINPCKIWDRRLDVVGDLVGTSDHRVTALEVRVAELEEALLEVIAATGRLVPSPKSTQPRSAVNGFGMLE
jgi:type II secretory pathway predicted ATPase ExeA